MPRPLLVLQENLRRNRFPAHGIDPARWWWRAGWLVMAGHVLMAFGAVHGWSHRAAEEATARQVEAVVGWRSGAGVWANHGFMGAWMVVSLAWGRLGLGWRRVWWVAFVFMGFHASVVFVEWPARWLGLAWLVAAMAGLGRSWSGGRRVAVGSVEREERGSGQRQPWR